MSDFMLLLPTLVIVAGAITLMLLAAWDKLRVETGSYVSMGFFALAFLLQLMSCSPGQELFPTIFNGMLVSSSFSTVACLVILGCGFFTAMSANSYFRANPFCTVEFYGLMLFASSGMMLLAMAAELITAFIAIEIMSLAIYVMVGYDRGSLKASEAILKYLMLGAFAGAFFTMGTALIYGAAKSTKFVVLASMLAGQTAMPPLVVGGAFFIFVALLFKVAAFPFHAWVVDVYEGASLPVTGFMATALKTGVFAMFANFVAASSGLQVNWVNFIFWVCVLTMLAGNLIAIGQNNIKRMLAASGIVHSGYLLIGLAAISAEHFSGAVIGYYLAAYAVGTLGIFAALIHLGGVGEKRISFDDFRGLAKVRPFHAAAITVFLLSMAGIPPTAGFMGKFYIITSAIAADQIALAVFGVISSILSMWYYLRLIVAMYFKEGEDDFASASGAELAGACTFILVFCVFAIGIYPIVI